MNDNSNQPSFHIVINNELDLENNSPALDNSLVLYEKNSKNTDEFCGYFYFVNYLFRN